MRKLLLLLCALSFAACVPWRGEAETRSNEDGLVLSDRAYTVTTGESTAILLPTLTLSSVLTPRAIVHTDTPRPTRTVSATPESNVPESAVESTRTPEAVPTEMPHPEAMVPYPDAPPCTFHDTTGWHGLWNSELGCHYDHTHFADPTAPEVVALFGDYTQYTGQGISYPWQTFAGAMPGYPTPGVDVYYENEAKHPGYKFDFYDFPPHEYGCPTSLANTKAVPNAWLIERHSLGHKPDFMSRVHSVWAMVRFCIPNAPGEEAWLFTGGWQDFGQRTSPYKTNIVPVQGNPDPPYPANRAPYIAHSCIGHSDCRGPDNISNVSWISLQQIDVGGHRLFAFGFRSNDSQQKLDASLGFDQPDPTFVYLCADSEGNYVAAGCKFNHSTGHTYQITGDIDAGLDMLDGAEDGRVNYEGWTDRWGNIMLTDCTVASLDCVPVKMVNLPIGRYHVNTAAFGIPDHRGNPHLGIPEYSICFLPSGKLANCATKNAADAGWIGPEN